MPEENATALNDIAAQELPAALAPLDAGDELQRSRVRDFERFVRSIDSATRNTMAKAKQLHADDVMAPSGKARLLRELPAELVRTTNDALEKADSILGLIEDLHLAAILRHDNRDDANLRAELDHYVAAIVTKPETAATTLLGLAGDVRYSTYLSGPMGRSLAARFGLKADRFQEVALKALAENGTQEQVRRSKALAAIPAARRVLGLVRGGRDHVAERSQVAPAREPSSAMFS